MNSGAEAFVDAVDSAIKHPSDNALVREAQLGLSALASIPEALSESFDKDHRLGTLGMAATAAGITFALAALKRDPSLAWSAERVLAPALALTAAKDIAVNAGAIGNAVADNWHSQRHWDKNVNTMKNSVGRFAADFTVSALAGGLAETAGRSYFDFKTPGVSKLPELNTENLRNNWARHMDGDIVPYKIYSERGGGWRRVDLMMPAQFRVQPQMNMLIAADGLHQGFGPLRSASKTHMAIENGLGNLRTNTDIDYVGLFVHPREFRVLPGVNLAAWHHKGGLINSGGLFAPVAKFDDVAYISDADRAVRRVLPSLGQATFAGTSSGSTLATESAAQLGSGRIPKVIAVNAPFTGLESPANAQQFRLSVNDRNDKILLPQGGVGGWARILPLLGHDNVARSNPAGQTRYALQPYEGSQIVETVGDDIIAGGELKTYTVDGKPVAAQLEVDAGGHRVWPANINRVVSDIVNDNFSQFGVTHLTPRPEPRRYGT
jgi:hypothetical protein